MRYMTWSALFAVLSLCGCMGAEGDEEASLTDEDDDTKTDGWFDGPECPDARAVATLYCEEESGNSLDFVRHEGVYQLSESVVVENFGEESLVCTYLPALSEEPTWTSEYVVSEESVTVSSVEALEDVVARVDDLREDDVVTISSPTVTVWYDIGWFNSLSEELVGLSTGLEFFDASDSPENPEANKTVFVIDETSYNAGFGGTYRTGSRCVLEVETGALETD